MIIKDFMKKEWYCKCIGCAIGTGEINPPGGIIKENLPDVNLYLKNNYKKKKDIEISKEIYITEFEKVL